MLFSIEFGYGKLDYKVYAEDSPPPTSQNWKEVNGRQFTLLARFHQMLNAGRRPEFSAFVGLGLIQVRGISIWTSDYYGIPYVSNPDERDGFIIIPIGLSLNFANIRRTEFVIDFGYMFSPKTGTGYIYAGPSGIIASLRTRMRL